MGNKFNLTIEELKDLLYECYSKDLCYFKLKEQWKENNKSLGMCAITALIVNDYFYGKICKIYVNDISHYFNYVDNKIIDLTSSQFKCDINYDNYEVVARKDILNQDTINRYNLLKEKINNLLILKGL